MTETTPKDVLGLRTQQSVETDKTDVYFQLTQAILESQRRTTVIQEWMVLDQKDTGEEVEKHLETLSGSAFDLLVRIHNQLADKYRYRLVSEPQQLIFESQEHADAVWEKGLSALNPEQAKEALRVINREIQSIKTLHELSDIATQKIEAAIQSKNVSQYLMWWSARRRLNATWIADMSEYLSGSNEGILPTSELVKLIEEDEKRWTAEAKVFTRLSKMINSIPVDPTRPRIAMVRMPREVDKDGRVRLLIDFPPNTFKDNGGMYLKADEDRRTFYTGHEAPLCVMDAYYRFYQLMRKETKPGVFEPRAGYLTPYVASGTEGIEDFPEEAQHFIQISFAGSDEVLPKLMEEVAEKFPGVIYARKDAIDDKDLDRVYTGSDGLAHFIMAKDDLGEPIRQDTVQYALQAAMTGFSNVTNVPVEQLIDWNK